MLPGSLYMYLSIDADIITRSTRYPLFTVFSVVSAVGLAVFILLIWRRMAERRQANSLLSYNEERTTINDVIHTLKIAIRLMKTRTMLLLLIPFAYTGKDEKATLLSLQALSMCADATMGTYSRLFSNLFSNCLLYLYRPLHQVWRSGSTVYELIREISGFSRYS